MSEENKSATETTTTEAPKAPEGVKTLAKTFEETGKLVYENGNYPEEFGSLVQGLEGYQDWTQTDDKTGELKPGFQGVALVRTKPKKDEEGVQPEVRVVSIPTMDAVFNDPTARANLYNKFVNMLVKAAAKTSSVASQFASIAGPLSDPYDLDAYRFQGKRMVQYLKDLGDKAGNKQMKAISYRALKDALENSAFAKTLFPGFNAWDKILDGMKAFAIQHGHSGALFDYWKATRDAKTYNPKDMQLGEASDILAALEAMPDEDDDESAE